MSSSAAPRCRHIKVNGTQCGSPALRNKNFCFYHEQDRPETIECYSDSKYATGEIPLPPFEDAHSVQTVIRQVVQMVLQKRLEQKTASLVLYALQIASSNLKRMELERPQPEQVVVNLANESETTMAALDEATSENLTPENSTNAQPENAQPELNDTAISASAEAGEDLPFGTIQACSSDFAAHREGEKFLGRPERGLARRADRFEPSRDIHLRVPFAAEMPRRRAIRGGQIPLNYGELQISALDHKPVDRMVADNPANLALKFPKTRHAVSVKQRTMNDERCLAKNLV